MSSALAFHNVSKQFKKGKSLINALSNVSFDIEEGEVYGFVGPNGAGKSTTIKIMLDIINDYTGSVHIHGIPAHNAEARRHVAYVPESPAIYEQLTPVEILKIALSMYGIRRKDETKWCREWLERLSIGHAANQRMSQLSKGTVQRVALAHAMVVSPTLLILDEPLSGLDPVGRKDVVNILSEFKVHGGSIFFTSHVLHDVERIADQFGFINKGELLTSRSPREVISEHADRFIVRYQGKTPLSTTAIKNRESEYEQECSKLDLPELITSINTIGYEIISITSAVSLETVFFEILANATHHKHQ